MKSILFLIYFCFTPVWAQSPKAQPEANMGGELKMNDIQLSDYSNFETLWKQVTVRYRQDTGEMRFVYANPEAYKTLSEGKTNYPDGAVFAKIGVASKEDPAFPSSVIPSGAQRIQFMVRDQKKYRSTDGWGFALFDSHGKTMAGDPIPTATQACIACHRIVKDHGHVFSIPLFFQIGNGPNKTSVGEIRKSLQTQQFDRMNRSLLSSELKNALPAGFESVLTLQGAVQASLFSGTLDEIQPLLAKFASEKGMPVGLFSSDRKSFSVVYPVPAAPACKVSGKSGIQMTGLRSSGISSIPMIQKHFCQP